MERKRNSVNTESVSTKQKNLNSFYANNNLNYLFFNQLIAFMREEYLKKMNVFNKYNFNSNFDNRLTYNNPENINVTTNTKIENESKIEESSEITLQENINENNSFASNLEEITNIENFSNNNTPIEEESLEDTEMQEIKEQTKQALENPEITDTTIYSFMSSLYSNNLNQWSARTMIDSLFKISEKDASKRKEITELLFTYFHKVKDINLKIKINETLFNIYKNNLMSFEKNNKDKKAINRIFTKDKKFKNYKPVHTNIANKVNMKVQKLKKIARSLFNLCVKIKNIFKHLARCFKICSCVEKNNNHVAQPNVVKTKKKLPTRAMTPSQSDGILERLTNANNNFMQNREINII